MTAAAPPAVSSGIGGAGRLTARDALLVIGAFLVSRLLLTLVGILTLNSGPPMAGDLLAATSYAATLPDLFVRWDSLWYISLAQHGYSLVSPELQPGATSYAFYPLYPALMWIVASLTGLSAAMAGLLISNLCFLAALFVIFILALRWSSDRAIAALAVTLLCFVPESFVFSAVYTESLFLLLTAGSMLLFERRQNALAGIVAALGAAARSNGVLIVAYFGLSLLRERGVAGSLTFWKQPERYLPIVLAPLGLFAFWWFGLLTTGDAFAQKTTMLHGWLWQADLPWNNIIRELLGSDPRTQFLMGASLVAFVASLTLLRRDSWPLFIYCLINFLLFWTGNLSNSLLRYSIVLFPIFFGLARFTIRRPVGIAVLLVMFTGLDIVLMGLWALGSRLAL